MPAREDDPMWCLVMFDLPTLTKTERREATRFRNLLLDLGFWRAQWSVYVRFTPTAGGSATTVRDIKANLPPGGEVRVVFITDIQWAKALRFSQAVADLSVEKPSQLAIF